MKRAEVVDIGAAQQRDDVLAVDSSRSIRSRSDAPTEGSIGRWIRSAQAGRRRGPPRRFVHAAQVADGAEPEGGDARLVGLGQVGRVAER